MEDSPADAVVRSRGRRVGRAILVIILVGFPVLVLALAVRTGFGPVLVVDQALLTAATDLTRRWGLTAVLIFVQVAGHPVVMYSAGTLVAAWVYFAKGLRSRAIWAFLTMMVGWVLAEVMKMVVQRVRPVLDPPLALAPGYSFPSGHALNATVAITVVLLLVWPLLPAVGRVVAVGVGILVVLAVGLDRVLLGVHFPSDVLAGFVLGCCITFSSWIGFVGRMGGTSSPS